MFVKGRLAGVEPSDSVAGYRDSQGRHHVAVSNRVCLCVPRFGVIRNEAIKQGMLTLRQDGWRKVNMGITTLDEVARVTSGDIIA